MADVKEVKWLEAELTAARKSARTALLASAEGSVEQLRAIGYEYELTALNGSVEARKPRLCGKCGGENHTARTCPKKKGEGQ